MPNLTYIRNYVAPKVGIESVTAPQLKNMVGESEKKLTFEKVR